MLKLNAPYWMMSDQMPGLDFNRAVVEPGVNDKFPEGTLAVYVDSDFWCVAALPLEPYSRMTIEEIVRLLWPTYAEQATYLPDHGSKEQEDHFRDLQRRRTAEWAALDVAEIERLRNENARLKRGRTDVVSRSPSRLEMSESYFVRQYEHLLTAMAHDAVPDAHSPGVCSLCGLYLSNRVHEREWIEKPLRSPSLPIHPDEDGRRVTP